MRVRIRLADGATGELIRYQLAASEPLPLLGSFGRWAHREHIYPTPRTPALHSRPGSLYSQGMENYKITDHAGTTLHEFEARHQAEAILFANTFDETHGLTSSKLWIKQDDGWWLAV